MEKKYKTELDSESGLLRIIALKDFSNVRKGDKGGLIEKEENLSQEGDCWIYDNARVVGNARVLHNAKIYDNAWVGGNAVILEHALVYDNALIFGNACVSGNAEIYDRVKVYDNARVHGEAQIYDTSRIRNNAKVYGSAIVAGDSRIYDDAKVYDEVHIYSSFVCGSAQVFENAVLHYGPYVGEHAQVKGHAKVIGLAEIFGDAVVTKKGDYLVLHKWWAEITQYITWTRSNGKYTDGSFHGTAEEFLENSNRDSVIFNYAYKQIVEYVNKISEIEV